MVTWREVRKRPIGVGILDIKHLKFLCNLIGSSSGIPFEKDNLHVWDLFEYCLGSVLRQRCDINSNQDRDEREQTLLLCIQMVFQHLNRTGTDELIKTKTANWLEPLIIRGYLDCALVILEVLAQLGTTSNLLDTVFESYAAAPRLGDDQLRYHRVFLILCTENLLKSNVTIGEGQTQRKVTSIRSIVHMCAANLPLSLVAAWFDMVFPAESSHSDVLSAMKTARVGGKTMFQWVIYHDRCDVVLWLLEFFPGGVERGLCWAEFVAASIGNGNAKFGEIRFSIYHEHVQNHLSSDENEELLLNLMSRFAIPTDSVDLFTELLKLLALDCDKQTFSGFLHLIVRWNAVRIAEFCLGDQISDQINWQALLQESEDGTPLELCRLLGHNYLYKLLSSRVQPTFPETKLEKTDTLEPDSTDPAAYEPVGYGLLRTLIDLNEKTKLHQETFQGYQRYPIIPDPWMSAVAQNQVSHLQALSLSRTPDPAVSTCILILGAIKTASLDALKWIVNYSTPITKHLSDEEAIECLNAAAKHPSPVYATMTLLLLENQLNPGRLSGDGMGIPLLHRAACFSNVTLACRLMTILLERSDCDVNVLDAFGNTAVSYAIACGCIRNACFLIQNAKCRLEAEYEGQSSFYYVLHLAPSFSWRLILRELLVLRDRAFLHCDAEDRTCGCKGFEGGGALCGFCEHGYNSHHVVPLPSWFRDQYDTYLNSPMKRFHSRSDEGDDSENEASQLNPTGEDISRDEDEEIVLENTRGRLNVAFLKRITVLRYDDILQANGLSVETEEIAEETASDNNYSPSENGLSNPIEILDEVSTVAFNTEDQQDDQCVDFNIFDANRKEMSCRKFIGAWWLRQEIGMVHSPRCLCQNSGVAVYPSQLVHVAVCRWLRRMAIRMQNSRDTASEMVTESSIVAFASVQPAFEHWRVVAKQSPLEAVRKPLPRTLSSLLFHWRYGQVFMAFQRWKNHQTTMEVTHHRLSSRFELVVAERRRNRLETLQLRQLQLEASIQDLL
ncbi:hypothetical protein P3T76_013677 [Phytophthora citrophthora]|uniref:Ankyrin repeat protein n=1 Tax=Phytophthora citrophthora TaxID=4793 RepID=A0AAD9G2T8_9STRA|nr:hypothetical protein P3T76_013677 [Phytophthora citrophthora]